MPNERLVSLQGADLRGVSIRGAELWEVDLLGV
jgi:uncharacterized protein YjbI with pentapeptide repeats